MSDSKRQFSNTVQYSFVLLQMEVFCFDHPYCGPVYCWLYWDCFLNFILSSMINTGSSKKDETLCELKLKLQITLKKWFYIELSDLKVRKNKEIFWSIICGTLCNIVLLLLDEWILSEYFILYKFKVVWYIFLIRRCRSCQQNGQF